MSKTVILNFRGFPIYSFCKNRNWAIGLISHKICETEKILNFHTVSLESSINFSAKWVLGTHLKIATKSIKFANESFLSKVSLVDQDHCSRRTSLAPSLVSFPKTSCIPRQLPTFFDAFCFWRVI